jgi:hypothetical protein
MSLISSWTSSNLATASNLKWACSSVGRAEHWQCLGSWFESSQVHHFMKKLKIGKEYEVQGRFAVLESIEGSMVVMRDRWDNVFECEISYIKPKRKFKKLP